MNTIKTDEHIFIVDYNDESSEIFNYDQVDVERINAISILRNRKFVRISIEDFLNKNF
jgi:hypothetical protein